MNQAKYQIIINESKCIAAASCVGVAMKTFKINDRNVVEVIDEKGNDSAQILLAAQSCPTQAIILVEQKSSSQIWPMT